MQGTIVLQSSRMGKAFAPCQHRHEKSRKGGSGVDLVGGPPADRHVLPNLFHEPDLPQIGDKDRHTAQRRYGTSGLAESQPLIRQQRLDLARDCIVRCFWFHPSVFSDSYLNWKTELRHSGLLALSVVLESPFITDFSSSITVHSFNHRHAASKTFGRGRHWTTALLAGSRPLELAVPLKA